MTYLSVGGGGGWRIICAGSYHVVSLSRKPKRYSSPCLPNTKTATSERWGWLSLSYRDVGTGSLFEHEDVPVVSYRKRKSTH